MPVIFDDGDNWIQSEIIPRINIGAGGTSNRDFQIIKQGHFVGMSWAWSFSNSLTALEASNIGVAITKTLGNAEIFYGDQFAGSQTIRSRMRNGNATAEIIGGWLMMYFKK